VPTPPKATVIVQARMGSSRLPGKILRDLGGTPMLAWLVRRCSSSEMVEEMVIATTTEPADDSTADLADRLGVRCFRGHPTDVLARVAGAAEAVGATTVARVSGDSPFLDRTPIDAVVDTFAHGGADLVENHREPGWPVGTAVEVLSRETLDRIAASATQPGHREHVTLYAYESGDTIETAHVPPPADVTAADLRLCVDTREDLERAQRIAAALGPGEDFTLSEIVAFARSNPEAVR
jgi:spore coat polysaccharide biosynthesis protein SpsF